MSFIFTLEPLLRSLVLHMWRLVAIRIIGLMLSVVMTNVTRGLSGMKCVLCRCVLQYFSL